MLAVGADAGEGVHRFLGQRLVEAFLHQLGVAEDGGERGPQLVAHVGDELRLVLARDLKLAALLRDLFEQPRVLDGDHGLVGEGLTSSICLSVKGFTTLRCNAITPIGTPSRSSGTPSIVRYFPSLRASRIAYSESTRHVRDVNCRAFDAALPAIEPRSSCGGSAQEKLEMLCIGALWPRPGETCHRPA